MTMNLDQSWLNAAGAPVTDEFVFCAVWEENPAPVLTSVSIESLPEKVIYETGEDFNSTGLQLKLVYSDGSTATVSDGFTISGFDSVSTGEKEITVTFRDKTTTFVVTVVEPIIGPVPGDVDGNGEVDIFDLIYLKQYFASTLSEDDIVLMNCDVNGDGDYTIDDIIYLKKILASAV